MPTSISCFRTAEIAIACAIAWPAALASANAPPPDWFLPNVAFRNNDGDQEIAPGGTLTFEIEASDPDSAVVEVTLLVDDEPVRTLTEPPWVFADVPFPNEGTHAVSARARTAAGREQNRGGPLVFVRKPDDPTPSPRTDPPRPAPDDAGCFASVPPRRWLGPGIALTLAIVAGVRLRRRG